MLDLLDLEVSTHCNLHCKWCFVDALRDRRHMSWQTALSAARQARRLGASTLHLTGGEPLVWPHFWRLAELAGGLGFSRLVVNTNGLLLDQEAVERLAGLDIPVALTISLDGPRPHHEANRGSGTYLPTLESTARALAAGLAVRIFTVVTRSLVGRAQEFAEALFELFGDLEGLSFIPVGDVQSADQCPGAPHDTESLTPSEIVDLTEVSAAFLLSGRSVRILDFPLANLVYKALRLPVSLVGSHCTACRGRIAVQADGTITPCHPVWKSVGHMADDGLEGALSNPVCQAVAARDFAMCRTCPDRAICGHCRAVVLSSGRDILGNDGTCVGLRRELRRRPHLIDEVVERMEALERIRNTPAPLRREYAFSVLAGQPSTQWEVYRVVP